MSRYYKNKYGISFEILTSEETDFSAYQRQIFCFTNNTMLTTV